MATQRILQNHLLVWVDGSIDENEADTQHTLEKLRTIVRHVTVFTNIDACMEFVQGIRKEKALVITSESMGQDLVEHIHTLPQVEAIYIFCGNVALHEGWTKAWSKIRGVHNHIHPICEALQTAVKQSNEDLTPISFVQQATAEGGTEVNLNQLEPSFMYTTLFKRVLLDMKHEPDERHALIKFCRAQFRDNRDELKIVEEFNCDYRPDRAIWWYTRECFLYQMLNRALRLLESDIIVDMGFFLRDLHRQLEQLHHQQFDDYHGPALTLFRGQGLSDDDFSKLKKSCGGLIAFNSFLSTCRDQAVSREFAERNSNRDGMVGILFVMTVDPTIESATFAEIREQSAFAKEEEILFTMHTVFRIGPVTPTDDSQRVFEVQLTLTSDDDPDLRRLTDRMEQDISGGTGWERVGWVLLYVGLVHKAEEFYLALLEKQPNEQDQALYYHQLGLIKNEQADYPKAVEYYEKAIAIREKILSPTDFQLATSYNNIGMVYTNIGKYPQALSYYNRALGIKETHLPVNHSSLAISYGNIGTVYKNMGDYFQALSYYNTALGIQKTNLPANHPHLAISYGNIGTVYQNMGEYSQALSYYNKALIIHEKTLPVNHPSLAISYNNIGAIYHALRQYSNALPYFQKALAIRQRTLPPGHPHTQSTLEWLEDVQEKLVLVGDTHF